MSITIVTLTSTIIPTATATATATATTTTTDATIPSLPHCQWTISVTDCVDQEYFKLVNFVSVYFSLFVFLSAFWLLAWRLYSKPQLKLFSLSGFLSMEGFLFTQIIWGGLHVVSCLILVYNLFAKNWTLRELTSESTWLIGTISVATYLAGVLRTIPRMEFFRNNPHYKHALHLPNLRGIAVVYFSYVIVLSIIVIICTVITGYLRQTGADASGINVLMVIHYGTYSISCFVIALGYMIYGRKLINLAQEGLHSMEGLSEYKAHKSARSKRSTYGTVGAELELRHKKLKQGVRKMRFIHFAFISSFLVMALTLAAFAFMHEYIFDNLVLSQIFAAVSSWFPLLLNVGVMAGIAYGEMRVPDKSVPTLQNIVTIHPDSIVIHQQRPSSVISHSRNTSTDSEAPLLRWPLPTAISPLGGARRYSVTTSPPQQAPSQPTAGSTATSSPSNSTTSII